MIRTVNVNLANRSYDIMIGNGLIAQARDILMPFNMTKAPIIVTDENVARTQLQSLIDAIGGDVRTIILPAGEASKSWTQLSGLCDQLLSHGVERNNHIIALGGGVIGDLVGFAASILKRGCGFIQIPTTLLAQVDSSVGGKTAINTAAGKNLVGSFYQPALVLIDPDVLDTLPPRDVRAGYAEVVKYGLINDPAFFEWCELNGAAVISGNADARLHAIETSVRAKAAIVAADERETHDLRALLNLGHTFGHALEAEAGFSDLLLHGEGVAAGMALAFRYSAERGLCAAPDAARVSAHLAKVGLPTGLAALKSDASGADLVAHMLHDKKMSGGTLPFLLARGIGQAFIDKSVALSDVAAFLDKELR
jgi:3-dehydroquinate synthase